MVIVVLGMHKSGTTLVSEILHKSGINMVEQFDEEQGYYKGNKMERASTLDLNHEMLNSRGVSSLDIPVTPEALDPSPAQIKRMEEIIDDCNIRYKFWGFKDPRTCITYNIWKKLLPPHRLIVVYRHPAKILAHYNKRSTFMDRISRYFRAMEKWKANNQLLLAHISQSEYPQIIINYEDLMRGDNTFKHLSEFVGLKLHDARDCNISENTNTKNKLWKLFDKLTPGNAEDIYQQLESHKSC